jgi:DNA repair protein RadC
MARRSSTPPGVSELALPFAGFLPRETVSPNHDDCASLSDTDLLGRLLRHNGGLGAAYIIIDEFGSAPAAASASVGDFIHRTGLDAAVHQDLQLAAELGVRMARPALEERCVLGSWSVLVQYLRSRLAHAKTEQFRVLFLDNKNRLIRDEVLGQGSIGHAPVYPREVLRRALEIQAKSLLLIHNHPSGDPTPSQADIQLTKTLVEGAKLLDITIHDHVIVASDECLSFRSKGLI